MRIVITAGQHHRDVPSGANRLAFDEARHLCSLGHDVWMIVEDPSGTRPVYELDHNVHVLRYTLGSVTWFNPRRAWIHQAQVAKLLAQYLDRADVIHGHSLLQFDAVRSVLGGNAVGVKYSVHSPAVLEMKLNWQ